MESITPATESSTFENPLLNASTTVAIPSPIFWTIVPTASYIRDMAEPILSATCDTAEPSALMTDAIAVTNGAAAPSPMPAISTAAPNASIPTAATSRAGPSKAKTAARPAITTPNATIATAPSVPVLATLDMVSAIADTAAPKTPMPRALA